MKISAYFYPPLVVLAILQKLGCANSQEYKKLCPDDNHLSCNNNQILHIEKVSVRSNRPECLSPQEDKDCSLEISQQENTLNDTVKDSCQDESSCTINVTSISIADIQCPPNTEFPNDELSSPRPPDESYHIHVQYTCQSLLDFTISEGEMPSRRILQNTTQRVLSPRYPENMSKRSQNITCVFIRPSQSGNTFTKDTVKVTVELNELLLNGAEQLDFKSDSKQNPSYSNVVTKNEVNTRLDVKNNFTMHFSRCTTLTPGGKFNISFTVEQEFEMSCTYTETECNETVSSTTTVATVVPDGEHKPTEDDSKFGVIVGGAVAGFLILLLFVVILVLYCKLKKKRQRENLPVEKREQRKQPPAGRFSSYGDRASNVYQEIGDNDPTVHYYSEIGHVNSLFEKAKSLDYDSRPAPEIPRINNRAPLDVVDELEPGYNKIKEDKEKTKNGEVAGYATPNLKGSNQIAEDVDDKEDSENSFSKLIDSEKPEIEDDYAKPDKENKSKRKVDNVDEGVDVGHPDVRRIGSEMIMEDNMDLYMSADETEGITADIVFQNSNNNNNIANKEENAINA